MRGWSLALSSAALASAAHGLAGGGVPDTALAVPLTVLVAWAGTALADRRPGVVGVLAALGMSQLAMHVLLDRVATDHVGAGHHGHTASVDPGAMLALHVVATVLTAVLLTRADVALRAVSTAVHLLLGLLAVPCSPPGVRPSGAVAVLPAARAGYLLEVVLRRVSPRRGPPVRS